LTIGVNLRILGASAAALTLAFAPAAHANAHDVTAAGLSVCNTASQNWQGGDLTVSALDPQGALHYSDDLRPKNDNGVGLVNAAMHSRALALCGDPAPVDPGTGGGGGTGPGPVIGT